MNFTCCGQAPKWIDNVPGKEYWYCPECKNEVLEPKGILDIGTVVPGVPDDINDWDTATWDMVYKLYKP